jgi:hypothetical protein
MDTAADVRSGVAWLTGVEGTRHRAVRLVAALALLALMVTGCGSTGQPEQSQADRVNAAFDRDAGAIRQKEGLPSAPSAHLLAGTTQLADGTRVSLWVSDPEASAGVRSRCFYLDMETGTGAGGFGSCSMPSNELTISRNGEVVIGSVGTWPAKSVHVKTSAGAAQGAVTGGYFLVPATLVGTANTPFTVTLLDAEERPIGVVRDLTPPGSATPTR